MTSLHVASPMSSLPPRPMSGASGRYDYLFRDLRDQPWEPLGTTDAGRLAHVRERAEALFSQPPVAGKLPAVWTFFGQFVAHDLSFDARVALTDTGRSVASLRSPHFDLDAVYGRGPRGDPHLYQVQDPRKLAIGRNASGEPDLPRSDDDSLDHAATTEVNRRRTALIGDPRNDENTIVAQLHLAFLKFHNRLVDEGHGFEQARRLTRLHYQWVLLHEYLPLVCGPRCVDDAKARAGSALPSAAAPFVPYEFAFAAFRFGHSMVGAAYHLNDALEHERDGHPFALYVHDATDWRSRDRSAAQTLDGCRVLPRRWTVQWDRFLPVAGSDARAQRAQRIDARLAEPLQYLPLVVSEPVQRKLAFRTLLRGWQLGLPSGQRVARHLRLPPLASEHGNDDPLWIYVLREAEAFGDDGLGPVGARIVSDVCVRLLKQDPESLLHVPPDASPLHDRGGLRLADFLAYARVPITQEDWLRVTGGGPEA